MIRPGLLLILSLIVLTSICDTAAQLFLKKSINKLNFDIHSIKKILMFIGKLLLTPRVYIGALFSLLSLFIWLYVLSKADLNFAFSLDSMHYIFIAIASGIFLKEKVGFIRWTGTIAIMVGILLVTLS